MTFAKLLEIELFDHLTVCIYNVFTNHIYLIYTEKHDLALNNRQWSVFE